MIKFIFQRYFLYLFIGLEIVLMPLILSKENFGELEYLKSLVNLLPIFYLGTSTGFLFKYLRDKEDFSYSYLKGTIAISMIAAVVFLLSKQASSIIFIISITYTIARYIEKKFQAGGLIFFSMSVKPLNSLFLIMIFFIFYLVNIKNIEFGFLISLLLTVTVYYLFKSEFLNNFKPKPKNFFIQFKELIKKGFLFNLLTVLLGLYLFADRFIVKNYFKEDLHLFSLAFNFTQAGLLAFGALNIKSTFDYGKNLEGVTVKLLLKDLAKYLILYSIIVSLLIFATLVYQYNFNEYNGTIFYLLPLLVGSLLNGVFSVFFPLINYLKIEKVSIFLFSTILVFKMCFLLIVDIESLNPIYLILISSVLLSVFSILSYFSILMKIK